LRDKMNSVACQGVASAALCGWISYSSFPTPI
jgi:hypothetical protein